ncbi:MAG: 30S ribosomal protein S16 [Deltaproteobacteria bacterium]|nr:30S ribosomal protein S16 [Deltaproteobacteria bacterium]
MPVTIRLARYGAKKKPIYRIVASDSRSPRDGRFLDSLGTYDPSNKVSGVNLNVEGIQAWISKGAQVSDTVRKLLKQSVRSATSEQ